MNLRTLSSRAVMKSQSEAEYLNNAKKDFHLQVGQEENGFW